MRNIYIYTQQLNQQQPVRKDRGVSRQTRLYSWPAAGPTNWKYTRYVIPVEVPLMTSHVMKLENPNTKLQLVLWRRL